MEKKFLDEIASILEVSSNKVDKNTVLSEHTWDSLAWLETATFMDSEYNHMPTLKKLQKCVSISDLWDLLQKDMLDERK